MARILVADDEEGIRLYLREVLTFNGHDVVAAEDGQEALEEHERQSFDLLLTDLRMPRLDGMALLRRVRSDHPDVEVIVLTATSKVETAVEAMKLGAFDYLRKPIANKEELVLLVARAVERRRLLALRERTKREGDEGELPLSHGAPAMEAAVDALRKVAPTDATVLLTGESGTGKEIAARAIHRWSPRTDSPFVAVNCAALPEKLVESELFGHEKGAFTGADARRRGRIELADGGTFFLDEISELRIDLQSKLLRVVEERSFERVGGTQTIVADVRWIAATNGDLPRLVEEGVFRGDLYHRLAVFPVYLPPLRERTSDILPLARVLAARIGRRLGWGEPTINETVAEELAQYDWPGNVRELANVLERGLILAEGGDAERLGIGLRTLYKKLRRYELD